MRNLFTLLLLLCSFVGTAQILFEHQYDFQAEDYCRSMQQVSDLGYVLAGTTHSGQVADPTHIFVERTNAIGVPIWDSVYTTPNWTSANFIHQTTDLGYIVTGSIKASAADTASLYLMKLNDFGGVEWVKTHQLSMWHDEGMQVRETNDGGFIVAGTSYDNDTVSLGFLVKTDSIGDTLWTQTYVDTLLPYSSLYAVWPVNDGYAAVGGIAASSNTLDTTFIYLVRADTIGDSLWTGVYPNSTDFDICYDILQTPDKGFVLAGSTNIELPGADSADAYLMKVDSFGVRQWGRLFGGQGDDVFRSVQLTGDGGYVAAGYTDSYGVGDYNFYLVKTDEYGNQEWERNYGELNADEYAFAVWQSPTDDGYAVAGYQWYDAPLTADAYLVKTDQIGGTIGVEEQNTTAISVDVYPNPFTVTATVQINGEGEGATFLLYDLYGRIVKQLPVSSSSFILHSDQLSTGMYLYELRTESGTIAVGKLVIK